MTRDTAWSFIAEAEVSALFARIRKVRNEAKLSQAELARRVGVKRSAVTQWEHPGGTTPSVDHLVQIALETGACFEWLATGRGPSQFADGAFDPVSAAHCARDENESQILDQMRLLSPVKQRLALDILRVLAR